MAEREESAHGNEEPAEVSTAALAAPFVVREVPLTAVAFAESPAAAGRVTVRVAELRQRSTLAEDGQLTGVLDLPSRHLALRVSVRDVESGKVGPVHLLLEVPNLGGERLVAGGLQLGMFQRETVRPKSRGAFRISDPVGLKVPFFWRASDAGDRG